MLHPQLTPYAFNDRFLKPRLHDPEDLISLQCCSNREVAAYAKFCLGILSDVIDDEENRLP